MRTLRTDFVGPHPSRLEEMAIRRGLLRKGTLETHHVMEEDADDRVRSAHCTEVHMLLYVAALQGPLTKQTSSMHTEAQVPPKTERNYERRRANVMVCPAVDPTSDKLSQEAYLINSPIPPVRPQTFSLEVNIFFHSCHNAQL